MPITPAYFLGLELSYLAATVNASECWRALVAQPEYELAALFTLATAATSSAANGLAAIHKGTVDAVTYPHCQVDHLPDGLLQRDDAGGWSGQRMFVVEFDVHIPTAYDDDLEEGQVWFNEVIGRILTEMSRASAADPAGLIDMQNVSLMYGVGEPDDDSDGRQHGVARIGITANAEVF